MSALRAAWLVAAIGACAGCGGKLVATVPLASAEATGEASVSLPAGAKVDFPVKAGKVSSTEAVGLELHVELLQGGQVVGKLDCRGFRMKAAGVKMGSWELNEDCKTIVPSGGASAVRVTTHLNRKGAATFEGLAVEVRQAG